MRHLVTVLVLSLFPGPACNDDSDFDSDFDIDSDDSEDDMSLCNTTLLVGPHGCGKTSSVYALAQELGYKVYQTSLEVSSIFYYTPASQRGYTVLPSGRPHCFLLFLGHNLYQLSEDTDDIRFLW